MQPINPIQIRNLGVYGVIREAEVDNNLIPDGAVVKAVNVNFDRKGAVQLRPGITLIAQAYANPILGLHNALFSGVSNNCILAAASDGSNNIIYKSTGGAFSQSLTGDTKNLKTRFLTFSDNVIRVNGTDAMKAFTGSAWTTTGGVINVDDMASYPTKYLESFRARVYTSGNFSKPDRLFYSSVVASDGDTITWTPDSDYVDISPNDGENTTGLKRYFDKLLIFKPNYIYRFTSSATDPDPLIKVGTRSNESIVEAKGGLYFHHDSGFYNYNGGEPKEISRPISDFTDAIALSAYDDIAGWKDNDHIYWSVGDLTVEGVSFANVVFRYTISSDIWTIYSYPAEFTFGCGYNNGTTLYQIVGDTAGNVYTFNNGITDNGTAISYDLETKWYDLGFVEEQKTIQSLAFLCEKAQGSFISCKVDGDKQWQSLGQLFKWMMIADKEINCHRIKFKLSGMSTKEAFIFRGVDILKGLNRGLLQDEYRNS